MTTIQSGGELARLAGIFAGQPEFREFLAATWPDSSTIRTAADATALVKQLCAVHSRIEFDHDDAAADRFHCLIRIPYVNWQCGRFAI